MNSKNSGFVQDFSFVPLTGLFLSKKKLNQDHFMSLSKIGNFKIVSNPGNIGSLRPTIIPYPKQLLSLQPIIPKFSRKILPPLQPIIPKFSRKILPPLQPPVFIDLTKSSISEEKKKRKRDQDSNDEEEPQTKRRKIDYTFKPARVNMTTLIENILRINAPNKMKREEIIHSIEQKVKNKKITLKTSLRTDVAVRNGLNGLLKTERIRRSGNRNNHSYELIERDLYTSDKCVGTGSFDISDKSVETDNLDISDKSVETDSFSNEISLEKQVINLLYLRPKLSCEDIVDSLFGIYLGFKKEFCRVCKKERRMNKCLRCEYTTNKNEKEFHDKVLKTIVNLKDKNVIKCEMENLNRYVFSIK
jgi:hypothetical protein